MATRMGFYTGKLYDSSVDTSTIKECCQILNFKEPVLDDEELVVKKRAELKQKCDGCYGCEEAQKDLNAANSDAYKELESMISYTFKRRQFFTGKQIKDIITRCLNEVTSVDRRVKLVIFKTKYIDSKYPLSDNTLYSLSWTVDMNELKCYKKQR